MIDFRLVLCHCDQITGAPVLAYYANFGSMGGNDGEKRATVTFDALKKAGQRGVVASGWGGLKASTVPEDVFMINTVPHDWLFPRVSAVVHHGGAGTTAAGLRAGKPTLVCPFVGDQYFWGGIVEQLGVGPKPIRQSRLTVDSLAEGICIATQNASMQRRAEELGSKIRSEDGVARAVEIVNATVRF